MSMGSTFTRMLAIGGIATGLYAALAWTGASLLAWPAPIASLLAYTLAGLWSYMGHRGFTFRSTRRHREAAPRFVLSLAAGYGIAGLLPLVVTGWLGLPPEVSIALACVVIPALSYNVLGRLVFPREACAAAPGSA